MAKTKIELDLLKEELSSVSKKLDELSPEELSSITGGKGSHNIGFSSYRRFSDNVVYRSNTWCMGVDDNTKVNILVYNFNDTLPASGKVGPGLTYKSDASKSPCITALEFDSMPKLTFNDDLKYIGGPYKTN